MLGVVRSTVRLPAVVGRDGDSDGWSVAVGRPWISAPTDSKRPTIGRQDQVVEMGFDRFGFVRIDFARQTITVRPYPGSDADLGSFVVDHVIPRVTSETNLVVHGGAVVDGHGDAILAVGASGAGKSTLVTSWCLEDHKLLGDDTIRVDGMVAGCSFVGPRLWATSLAALGLKGSDDDATGGQKRRLGPEDGVILADRPAPIRRIVLLGAPPSSSTRLSAVKLLCEQALNLGAFDPVSLIQRVTALVDAVREVEVRPAWTSTGN
jgi:hypothetical protein